MIGPGDRLRRLASRVCDDATMTRVIDPLIADLQWQDAEAGGTWSRRAVRVASYVAFWRVLAACLWQRGWLARGGKTSAPASPIRVLAASAIVVSALTIVRTAQPLYRFPEEFEWGTSLEQTLMLMFGLPGCFVGTLPTGFFLGTVACVAGRPLFRRAAITIALLGFFMSGVSFALQQWVVPDANRSFRELASRVQVERPGDRRIRFSDDRVGEMTWTELGRHIAELPSAERQRSVRNFRVRLNYYSMFSMMAAPFVFGCVALGLAFGVTKRWRALTLALCAFAGWYFTRFDPAIWVGVIPAITAAWLPSAVAGLPLVFVFGRRLLHRS